MPTVELTDPKTGQTKHVELDGTPTQADLEELSGKIFPSASAAPQNPNTVMLKGVDGNMYPADKISGGALRYSVPAGGKDPFAIPGSPVTGSEGYGAYDRIYDPSTNSTRIVPQATKQPAFFGPAQTGGQPIPTSPAITAARQGGAPSLWQNAATGIANAGDASHFTGPGTAVDRGLAGMSNLVSRMVPRPTPNPGEKLTDTDKVLMGIPGAVGNLVAGIGGAPEVAVQAATTGAFAPGATIGYPSRIDNPEAAQDINAFQQGNINAAGLGPGGQAEKIKSGDIGGAVVQTLKKFQEDPVTGLATVFMLAGLGAGGLHATSLVRDELIKGSDQYRAQAQSAKTPEEAQYFQNLADQALRHATAIEAKVPAIGKSATNTLAFRQPMDTTGTTQALPVPESNVYKIPSPTGGAPAEAPPPTQEVEPAPVQFVAHETAKTPLLGDRSDNLTLDELRSQYPVPIPSDPVTDSHAALANLERDVAEGKSKLSAAGQTVDDYQKAREAGEPLPNARPPWGTPEPVNAEPTQGEAPKIGSKPVLTPVNSRATFQTAMQKHFNLSDDEASSTMALGDARANAWAKATGADVKDWYTSRIAAVGSGDARETGSYRGSTEFIANNKAILRGLTAPDVSSAVHELGHVFRRDMYREGGISPEDQSAVEEWVGVKDGVWREAHEEKFAQGFEKYLADGKAPTPVLANVFDKFKTWMVNLYKGVTNSPLKVDVSPEMKGIFDKMLGKGNEAVPGIEPTQGEASPRKLVKVLKKPADYAGSSNLDYMKMSDADKADMRQNAQDIGLETKTPYKVEDMVKDAANAPITIKDLKALDPGDVPKGEHSATWRLKVRNLLVNLKTEDTSARQAASDNPTTENKTAALEATKNLHLAHTHDSVLSREWGQSGNALQAVVEPTKSAQVQNALKNVPSLDELRPNEEPKTPRKGQNASAKEGGGKKPRAAKAWSEEDTAAAEARREAIRNRAPKVLHQGPHSNNPQTETPEFRNWFGESKVVDPFSRKPEVYYHGTDKAGFNTFDPMRGSVSGTERANNRGMHFTPEAEEASRYAKGYDLEADPQRGVYPVYIKAERPWDFENPSHVKAVADIINKKYADSDERSPLGYGEGVTKKLSSGDFYHVEKPDVIEAIKSLGHDSYYVQDAPYLPKNIAVFDPKQIKSAIGNRGTFDPNDANILHQSSPIDEATREDLIELGKLHIKAGARTFGQWFPEMQKEYAGTVGGKLGEADAQALWAHTRTDLAKDITKGQRKTAGAVFTDHLAVRFGSREKVSKFLDQIVDEDGSHSILDKILNGKTDELTADQKSTLAKAYKDNSKGKPKRKASVGALADVDKLMDEQRAAKKAALKGTKTPPTIETAFKARVRQGLGGTGSDNFYADVKSNTDAANILSRLHAGEALTSSDLKPLVDAYNAHKVTATGKIPSKFDAFNQALADAKKDATAAKNALPESRLNANLARRVGAQNVDAVKIDLGSTEVGKSALDKLRSGDLSSLTDDEKLSVANALKDARTPKALKPEGSGDELAATMSKIVADAKAGKLRYDNPIDQVRDQILKLNEDSPERVPGIAHALAGVETDASGMPTVKGTKQLAGVLEDYSKHSLLGTMSYIYKGGLLSGPQTLGKIALSHALSLLAEDTTVRGGAALTDYLAAKKTGVRSVQPPSASDSALSVWAGVKALGDTLHPYYGTLWHGENVATLRGKTPWMKPGDLHAEGGIPRYLGGSKLKPGINTAVDATNAIVRIPMRVHSALYRMVGSMAYERAIREAAWLKAKNEDLAAGKKSSFTDFRQRVADNYNTPTPEMMDFAREQYQQQMFMNENAANTALKTFVNNAPVTRGIVEANAPFAKVPFNVVGRSQEYNVLGAGGSLLNLSMKARTAKELTPGMQNNMARIAGRVATGTALTALGYELVRAGLYNAPDAKKYENGSLNAFGQKWDTSGTLPVAGPMNLGAAAAKYYADKAEGRPVSPLGASAEAALDQAKETPYSRFGDTISSFEKGDTALNRIGGTFAKSVLIPNFVSQYAAATDPLHAVRDKNTFTDYLKNSIPGQRETLPLKYDNLGLPIPEAGGLIGPMRHVPIQKLTAVQSRIKEIQELRDDLSQSMQKLRPGVDEKRNKLLQRAVKIANMVLFKQAEYRRQLSLGNTQVEKPDYDVDQLDQAIEIFKQIRDGKYGQ